MTSTLQRAVARDDPSSSRKVRASNISQVFVIFLIGNVRNHQLFYRNISYKSKILESIIWSISIEFHTENNSVRSENNILFEGRLMI